MSAMKLLGQLLGGGGASYGAKPGREADLLRMVERTLGQGGYGAPGGYGGLGAGGAGAVAGGVLGMLMKGGKKKPKHMSGFGGGGFGAGDLGSAAKIGGLGLVAGLAYKAWREHQAQQAAAAARPAADPYAAPAGSAFLPAKDAEQQRHARAILRAMIAMAKADGHVDDAERQRLHEAVDTLDLDADDKAFLFDELRAPLDVQAVAREAATPELATEIYAASLLMADETDARERAHLDSLAAALRLDPALARRLEAEVSAATG